MNADDKGGTPRGTRAAPLPLLSVDAQQLLEFVTFRRNAFSVHRCRKRDGRRKGR